MTGFTGKSKNGGVRKPLFKTLYKWHVSAGLFVAVHFAIFAVSGLVLLFKHEILGAPAAIEFSPAPPDLAARYAQALKSLQLQYPNDRPLALYPDDNDPAKLTARFGIDGATQLRGARKLSWDLANGHEITAPQKPATGFFDWMLRLHRELLLGSNGKLYVGFVGLVYVFLLLSGFVIYGGFMRNRGFGELRKARLPKLIDLHKFVGVVSFGWGLIVGLSGALLAFNGVLIKLFQFQSLRHLGDRYRDFSVESSALAPFESVLKTAMTAKDNWVVTYVSFPGTEFGIPGHFLFLINGTSPLTQRLSELLVINAETAQLTEIRELPFYLKAAMLSEPLHFGDYGGLFLKVLWAVFTLLSLAVVLFGVTSYVLKRRAHRVPVTAAEMPTSPRLHRMTTPLERYTAPVVLALLSVAAMVGALLTTGAGATVFAALLLIPLAVLLIRRRTP